MEHFDSSDPLGASWFSAPTSSASSSALPARQGTSAPSNTPSLPPLLQPPPPVPDEDNPYLETLEKRHALAKKRTLDLAASGAYSGDVLHAHSEEVTIYKTKLEAEVEPLLEKNEAGDLNDSEIDPSLHPRYAGLSRQTKPSKPTQEAEWSSDSDQESTIYDVAAELSDS